MSSMDSGWKRLIAAALLSSVMVEAQIQKRVTIIWSAVVVQMFGDRVPLLSTEMKTLTPLGSQQLFRSGQFYRQRYVSPVEGRLQMPGILENQFDPSQIYASSDGRAWSQQGAQAFLNGLYPPSQTLDMPESQKLEHMFSNGSQITAPLNGTQYFTIDSPTSGDAGSILLNGVSQCPAYDASVQEWKASSDVVSANNTNRDFYDSLSDLFAAALPSSELDYGNAYNVWEFLNYQVTHNNSAHSSHGKDLGVARQLAESYATGILTNTSNSNFTLAGRTLMGAISKALANNVQSQGENAKITALFTSYEPILSFAALMNLTDTPQFMGLPELAASFAVELISQGNYAGNSSLIFPSDVSELSVRIVWRNNSDIGTEAVAFPLTSVTFENSGDAVSYSKFLGFLDSSSVADPQTWCFFCDSSATFCPYYQGASTRVQLPEASLPSRSLSTVTAGAIGAMVTLIAILLTLVIAILLFGVRLRRDGSRLFDEKSFRHKSAAGRRRRSSNLGGFKGDRKLASDIDLPGEAFVRNSEPQSVHRRLASWEMKQSTGKKVDSSPEQSSDAVLEARCHVIGDDKDEDSVLESMKATESREYV